jgi:hypothetical protein
LASADAHLLCPVDHQFGLAALHDHRRQRLAAQTNDPNSLLSLYRQLIAIRNRHSALRTGSLTLINANNSAVYAALRMDGNESLLVLANLQNRPITDYDLALSNSNLSSGSASLTTIFGTGNFSGLTINANGSISNFKPLPQIPSYGMYILKISQ